jgi:hypothetical protein
VVVMVAIAVKIKNKTRQVSTLAGKTYISFHTAFNLQQTLVCWSPEEAHKLDGTQFQ